MESKQEADAHNLPPSQANPGGNSGQNEADFRMAKSEERYRRLFETAQDGILILNRGQPRRRIRQQFLRRRRVRRRWPRPLGAMPAFADDVVPKADLDDVAAYLKALRRNG